MDPSLSKRLEVPVASTLRNASTSALTSIHQRFSSGGTTRWPLKSVEWLLIYIITEFESTPNTSFGRGAIPEIQNAYRPVVRDLVGRPCCIQSTFRLLTSNYRSDVESLIFDATNVFAWFVNMSPALRKFRRSSAAPIGSSIFLRD